MFSSGGPIYNTLLFFQAIRGMPGDRENVLTSFFRPLATHILEVVFLLWNRFADTVLEALEMCKKAL